ncbi:NADH:flavin oxidoreductase/NADH oxidase [Rhizosphaericola mali]|uniref:NADH:flavin oxidoreductase/NADH oxidase n=1 Tax=Rhizosphaericola mali TaxID=2545455 RepID=A0A5P2FYB3_9BACT|nr:NADH:flavin oxidoreductase/NADH oxidase [Rhizosphaericola mali]QES87927.1 NADH:flavin oxidoreductase/NADH oxidase [Rhizosphaericola mali]
MAILFSPFTIRNKTFKNRLVMSPMCQYSAVDGFANNWHLVHLGSRAVTGIGTIITEAVAVSPEGRISADDLGIYKEDHVEKLKEITTFIKEQGVVPGIQLGHAGRKGSSYPEWKGAGTIPEKEGGWKTVGPSAIPFAPNYAAPQELSISDIQRIVNDFILGAKRSIAAGFDILELHAAHGYLIHQFLSPLSNQRTDEYGGSFENRIRFLLEIIDGVKAILPENILLYVRLSGTDWAEEGIKAWTIEESIELAKKLSEKEIDLLDVSSGGSIAQPKIPVGASYQLPLATAIKNAVPNLVIGAVGMINSAEQAETILLQNNADFIFMARELLRNPYWILDAAHKLHAKFDWPNQYRRANPNFKSHK